MQKYPIHGGDEDPEGDDVEPNPNPGPCQPGGQ